MSSSETTLYEVVDCARSTARRWTRLTDDVNTIPAPTDMCWVRVIYRSTRQPCKSSYEKRTVQALVVVAAEGLWQWMRESAAMTRMMPGAAEVMLEVSPVPLLLRLSAVGGTVDSDGADIARELEKEKTSGTSAFLGLPEMEAAI